MVMDLGGEPNDPWLYSSFMDVTETAGPDDDEAEEQIDSDDELDHINHSNEADTVDTTDNIITTGDSAPSFNLMDTSEEVPVQPLNRLQHRRALREARIKARIWKTVEDSLCFDPNLVMTADQLGIEESTMIVRNSRDQLEFQVLEHLFDVWLDRHQTFIGTSFSAHEKPKPYSTIITARSRESKKEKVGWTRQKFECHRRGLPKKKGQSSSPEGQDPPPEGQDPSPEGQHPSPEGTSNKTGSMESGLAATTSTTPSGALFNNKKRKRGKKKAVKNPSDQLTGDGKKVVKTRDVAPSIKCGCLSAFNAILKPVALKNGRIGKVYTIVYTWQHNHDLGNRTELGTQQKSAAICDRIKAMYLGGKSIAVIMNSLTMDYSRYISFVRKPGATRLTRDHFITYDDVYNIAYAINAKRMRKDADEFQSAKLWLDHLKTEGYFVYHDTENHRYHGFSSKWQLEELVKWGDVFCFDGTHHACG
jgi:hypothetical protein